MTSSNNLSKIDSTWQNLTIFSDHHSLHSLEEAKDSIELELLPSNYILLNIAYFTFE